MAVPSTPPGSDAARRPRRTGPHLYAQRWSLTPAAAHGKLTTPPLHPSHRPIGVTTALDVLRDLATAVAPILRDASDGRDVAEKLADVQIHLNLAMPFGQPLGTPLAMARTMFRQPFLEKPLVGQKVRSLAPPRPDPVPNRVVPSPNRVPPW